MSTLAQRIMEEGCDFDMMVKGCVCPDSAGPDDGPCDYCVIKAKVQTILAAALADTVRVEREEDYKAVCPGCAQGTPLDGPWHKGLTCTLDIRGGSGLCRATEIRARVGEGDATPGPEPKGFTSPWGGGHE